MRKLDLTTVPLPEFVSPATEAQIDQARAAVLHLATATDVDLKDPAAAYAALMGSQAHQAVLIGAGCTYPPTRNELINGLGFTTVVLHRLTIEARQ